MTAKDKAHEIFNSYFDLFTKLGTDEFKKEFSQAAAFVCVINIIKQIGENNADSKYWNEVVKIIENL